MVEKGSTKKGEHRKLKPKWKGPYRIINYVENMNNMVVDIQHTANPRDLQKVNVNRIYKEPEKK